MVVGLVMLEVVQVFGFYDMFVSCICLLCDGLQVVVDGEGVLFSMICVGGMFGLFFIVEKVEIFVQVMVVDMVMFNCFFYGMFVCGVYFVFLVFEVGFMFSVYSDQDIVDILQVVCEVLCEVCVV